MIKSYSNHVVIENENGLLGVIGRLPLKSSLSQWEYWNGESWGEEVEAKAVQSSNFTDYNVPSGLYLYKFNDLISSVIKVGEEKIGWSFGNYQCGDSWGEVLTPDDIRFSYMWGIDFRASNGEIFTDDQIRFCVNAALEEMERTLNHHFKKKIVKCEDNTGDIEESGYRIKNYGSNILITLRNAPVMNITRFDFHDYLGNQIVPLKEKIILDKAKGVVELRLGVLGTHGYYSPVARNLLIRENYRNAIKVDYVVGYENAGKIPNDVRDIIGKIATCKLLNVIGDGLIAGFSSSSLSMDGVSESFSSTQSATSAYFGARIKVYEDDISNWKKANLRKFKRITMGVI